MLGNLNQKVFQAIYGLSGRNAFLDSVGIFLAQYLIYFLVLGFLVILFYRKDWRERFYIFSEAAIAIMLSRGLVTEAIRFFYHHPRPFDALGFSPLISESGPSFPSGHMTFIFALAMVVWYADRRWGVWYFILGAFIGIARIYVGVHWPLDILGGIVIGILCAILTRTLLKGPRRALESKRGTAL